MTSLEMYQAQVRRDRKHHAERLEWLSEPSPKYSDGTPVSAIDVLNWKTTSQLCLADPTNSRGYNTGPQED
jgi:hypothetical protein